MSRELSLYEAMGGTYTEIEGVFYPDIIIEEIKPDGDFGVTNADIGKYGLLWISYMKENHPDRSPSYKNGTTLCQSTGSE